MIRHVNDHKVNGLNEALEINVLDGPGPGNASHNYLIGLGSTDKGDAQAWHLNFQNGPVSEGFNGLSNEVLMAVVIDRLRGFQSGQFACRENATALTHLETSLMWLQKRTRDRMLRGVEGTLQK